MFNKNMCDLENKKSMLKECKLCGTTEHHENAKYCWKCGTSFENDSFNRSIIDVLVNFKENELKDIKKDRRYGIPVRINPNSYFAKEISYQTTLLKQIINKLDMLNH